MSNSISDNDEFTEISDGNPQIDLDHSQSSVGDETTDVRSTNIDLKNNQQTHRFSL